jgi:hypothetical protein
MHEFLDTAYNYKLIGPRKYMALYKSACPSGKLKGINCA